MQKRHRVRLSQNQGRRRLILQYFAHTLSDKSILIYFYATQFRGNLYSMLVFLVGIWIEIKFIDVAMVEYQNIWTSC